MHWRLCAAFQWLVWHALSQYHACRHSVQLLRRWLRWPHWAQVRRSTALAQHSCSYLSCSSRRRRWDASMARHRMRTSACSSWPGGHLLPSISAQKLAASLRVDITAHCTSRCSSAAGAAAHAAMVASANGEPGSEAGSSGSRGPSESPRSGRPRACHSHVFATASTACSQIEISRTGVLSPSKACTVDSSDMKSSCTRPTAREIAAARCRSSDVSRLRGFVANSTTSVGAYAMPRASARQVAAWSGSGYTTGDAR